MTPQVGWDIYKSLSAYPTSADCGWLVQFGVYNFTGEDRFRFSLVRQFNTADPENDEYLQLELLLHAEPLPELIQLGRAHEWSFEFPSIEAFFAAWEGREDFRRIMSLRPVEWEADISLDET